MLFSMSQLLIRTQPTLDSSTTRPIHDWTFPSIQPDSLTLLTSHNHLCEFCAIFLPLGCVSQTFRGAWSRAWAWSQFGTVGQERSSQGWLTYSVGWNRYKTHHDKFTLHSISCRKPQPNREGDFPWWLWLRERPQQCWRWVFYLISHVYINDTISSANRQIQAQGRWHGRWWLPGKVTKEDRSCAYGWWQSPS